MPPILTALPYRYDSTQYNQLYYTQTSTPIETIKKESLIHNIIYFNFILKNGEQPKNRKLARKELVPHSI